MCILTIETQTLEDDWVRLIVVFVIEEVTGVKNMRVLGDMIEKLACETYGGSAAREELSCVLDCTPDQVSQVCQGRLFLSFPQLSRLAEQLHTTVDALLAGDENHYRENVVHCMGQFEREENREEILDIIDDYLRLKSSVR